MNFMFPHFNGLDDVLLAVFNVCPGEGQLPPARREKLDSAWPRG